MRLKDAIEQHTYHKTTQYQPLSTERQHIHFKWLNIHTHYCVTTTQPKVSTVEPLLMDISEMSMPL